MNRLKSALIVEYGYMRLLLFNKKNGSFVYCNEEKVNYDGFNQKGFINPDDVFYKIQHLYSVAEQYGNIDKKALVVLPGTFFKYNVAEKEIPIPSGTVTPNDVKNLLSACGTNLTAFDAVKTQPIAYKTLTNPTVENPIGEKADRLKALASVEYLFLGIKELFDNCAKRLNKNFDYVSYGTTVAKKALNNLHASDRYIILLADGNMDVVFCVNGIPTSVSSVMLGSRHVCYSLAEELKCEDALAEEIMNCVNLNLNFSASDVYRVGNEQYSVAVVNSCLGEAFIYLGGEAKNIIKETTNSIPSVLLTGSNICSARGVKDIFEEEIGVEIEVLNSNTLNLFGCGNYLAAAVENYLTVEETAGVLHRSKFRAIFGKR